MVKFMGFFDKIRLFVDKNISYDEVSASGASCRRLQSFGIFLIESYKSLVRHQTLTSASALAFKSIVALIPLIFIGIAVASMLGISEHDNYVNSFISSIEERLPNVPELQPLLELIRGLASKAREIVGLSFVVLFYIAYSLISNIEKAFNTIWQVERKRKLVNRILAYLAAIIIVPIMMSFSVYLNSQVEVVTMKMAHSIEETKDEAYALIISHLPGAKKDKTEVAADPVPDSVDSAEQVTDVPEPQQSFFVKIVLGLLSLTVTSLALAVLILFMPYTRVRIKPALIGGVCSGIILELMKLGFSFYVNYAAMNLTRLYGSTLLAFPLFLLWVWMVWMVILLGAEVAFNIQNYYDLVASEHLMRNGYAYPFYLAVIIMNHVCREFYSGRVAGGVVDNYQEYITDHSVPGIVVRNTVQKLTDATLLVEAHGAADSYVPGRDIAHITMLDIYRIVSDVEFTAPDTVLNRQAELIADVIKSAGGKVTAELEKVRLLDLVRVEDEAK